jgi:hypothetical protein
MWSPFQAKKPIFLKICIYDVFDIQIQGMQDIVMHMFNKLFDFFYLYL